MKTNSQTTETMKRGEFLRGLGLSSAALMSFYCMGTLTSCSSDDGGDPAPAPNPGPGTGTGNGITGNTDSSKGKVDFTLDLTNADYSKLKTQGESVKIGSVLVANTKGNKYVAIQRLCTHAQQDQVGYRMSSDDFFCGAHGSVFALDGSVTKAAANGQGAMKLYKTTLDGNSLKVSE